MRNLKKVLSLALALVMLLGMMVVGAGAAANTFGDNSSIEYKEAAAVLNAVNVLKGKDTGNFDPKGDLTRAQAATIIYRMIMGGMEKEPEPAVTGFSDVDGIARLSWATGYIAACQERGIIVGVSETRFNPDGKVKGTDFAKMLLVALGYDADSQGYSGSGYASSVARDARTRGITVSGVALEGYLNREQAAQMALNTLEADIVEQQPGMSINGVVIPGGKATTVAHATGDKTYDGQTVASGTTVNVKFCELYFPQLKQAPGETTDLGQPAAVWTVGDEEIASVSDEPVVTYTAATSEANIIKDLKNYKVVVSATDYPVDTATASSVTATGIVKTNGTTGNLLVNTVTPASVIAGLTGNGKIVEIYADGTTITDIVVIAKTVTKVSADPTTRTSNDEEQVRVPGVFSSWKSVDDVHGWEDLAKDDVVLYVTANNNVYIEKAEAIEGVVTATRNDELRIDGAYYGKSSLTGAATGWTANDFKNTYTFFLDNGGFIVAGTTEAQTTAATQYAVVLDNGWYTGSNLTEGAHGEAKLLFTDGSVEVVTVSHVNDATATHHAVNTTVINGLTNGEIVTYVESNGKYKLNTTTATSVGSGLTGLMVTKGAAQMSYNNNGNKVTVNNATIFLVQNGTSPNYTYSVYTGKDEVPSTSEAGAEILMNASGIARVVYITDGTASEISASDYVYIPSRTVSVTYVSVANEAGNGVAYYEVEGAIINGEEGTLRVKVRTGDNVDTNDDTTPEAELAPNTLYQVVSKEADTEAVTLFRDKTSDLATGVALGDGVVTVASSGTAYAVDEDTVIYRIATDNTVSSIAADSSFNDTSDKVLVVDSNNNGVAETVIIKEVVETGKALDQITYTVDGSGATDVTSFPANAYTITGQAAGAVIRITDVQVSAGASYEIDKTSVTVPGSDGADVTITITVTPEDGSASQAYTITVEKAAASAGDATLTVKDSSNATSGTLTQGVTDTDSLTATFSAGTSGLSVSTWEWTSSDTDVATVASSGNDQNATVTLVGKSGDATITCKATLSNGATLTATYTATCTGADGATVTLDQTTASLDSSNTTTVDLTATFNANEGSGSVSDPSTAYTWESSATNVATVAKKDNTAATVTYAGAGSTDVTVTVTLDNGAKITGTCKVTCT